MGGGNINNMHIYYLNWNKELSEEDGGITYYV